MGDEPCCQQDRLGGGGEGEAEVSEYAAANCFVDGRRFQVEELVQGMDRGVHRFTVDRWDGGVFRSS